MAVKLDYTTDADSIAKKFEKLLDVTEKQEKVGHKLDKNAKALDRTYNRLSHTSDRLTKKYRELNRASGVGRTGNVPSGGNIARGRGGTNMGVTKGQLLKRNVGVNNAFSGEADVLTSKRTRLPNVAKGALGARTSMMGFNAGQIASAGSKLGGVAGGAIGQLGELASFSAGAAALGGAAIAAGLSLQALTVASEKAMQLTEARVNKEREVANKLREVRKQAGERALTTYESEAPNRRYVNFAASIAPQADRFWKANQGELTRMGIGGANKVAAQKAFMEKMIGLPADKRGGTTMDDLFVEAATRFRTGQANTFAGAISSINVGNLNRTVKRYGSVEDAFEKKWGVDPAFLKGDPLLGMGHQDAYDALTGKFGWTSPLESRAIVQDRMLEFDMGPQGVRLASSAIGRQAAEEVDIVLGAKNEIARVLTQVQEDRLKVAQAEAEALRMIKDRLSVFTGGSAVTRAKEQTKAETAGVKAATQGRQ